MRIIEPANNCERTRKSPVVNLKFSQSLVTSAPAKWPKNCNCVSYGDASLPTLIYLPGLHGDWTLIGGFRHAIGDRVRFVEITYPRTLTWSLDDYAAAVETALTKKGITRGWLLGESFSSQVVWAMVARGTFAAQGVILAGGFVKYPNAGALVHEKNLRPRFNQVAGLDHLRLRQGGAFLLPPFATSPGDALTNLLPAGRNWTAARRNIACVWLPKMIRGPSPARPSCRCLA